MKYTKLFLVAIFASFALSACGGGASPTGPGPTPTTSPTPTANPTYLHINGAYPQSGSTICTGKSRGSTYLQVDVGFSLQANYSTSTMWFVAALSNDGFTAIPLSSQPVGTSDSSGTTRILWLPDRSVTSSEWLIVTYEYRPHGPFDETGKVPVASDKIEWKLRFDPGC